ncbi:MAG: DUF2520 domain-containing protein [Paludibacteraceae bacterium]|jgi:predicted short-subunit dehydrogenase-like oxidoreductase (DUF2520 family)|nr:DUF2520 domain-containing protein [Paludibacteraceae bacterium]
MRIIIIGQGNVACNLHAAFVRNNVSVEMVSSYTGLDTIAQNADAYIYAVTDTALEHVINQVHTPQRALHIHTSGTIPITVFGSDKPHCGILYPFQTLSKAHIIEDFTTVPVFIEARGIDDVSALYTLALTLTPHIYEASQADREKLHVAGVFANNFSNLMYTIAKDILSDTHIPFSALLPIIDETAAKIHSLAPKDAQTGPAIRNDQAVMAHHLEILKRPEYREAYKLLSALIQHEN